MEASLSFGSSTVRRNDRNMQVEALDLIGQSSVSSLTFLAVVNLSWCSTVYCVASLLQLQLSVLV